MVMARTIETPVVVVAIPRATVTDATLAMVVSGSRGRLEAAMAVVVGLLAITGANRQGTRLMLMMACALRSRHMASVRMDLGVASDMTHRSLLVSIKLWRRSLIGNSSE